MDFRCPKCGKLLFRGELNQGKIETKCPKCGTVLKVSAINTKTAANEGRVQEGGTIMK
jgi:phage FluMu protein Com